MKSTQSPSVYYCYTKLSFMSFVRSLLDFAKLGETTVPQQPAIKYASRQPLTQNVI